MKGIVVLWFCAFDSTQHLPVLMLAVSIPGITFEYELPFHGLVPSDPSFEDMKRIVVLERRQPTIPDQWHADVVCTYY